MTVELLTAAESEKSQAAAAAWLLDAGLQMGERVALLGDGQLNFMNVALGALRVGIVPVFVKPQLTAPERQLILDDSAPAMALSNEEMAAAVGFGRLADLAAVPLSRPMLYTSGTTGRPKGVWTGVLNEVDAQALVDEEATQWGFVAADVHLVVSELTHSAPFRFAMGTLLAGGTVVFSGGVAAAPEALAELDITSAFLAPAHLHRFMNQSRAIKTGRFRMIAHAGAPCPEPVKRWALESFPEGSVWEFYGSTEGQITACSTEDYRSHPSSVGRAREGRTISIDGDGTIWCDVPDYARFSYWQDPVRTAEAWRGSAFSIGDIGRLDDDGFLYLDGRRNDLIITGGVNVYPLEVERAIAACPGVQDVAVFGIESERWGQQVCAAVVGAVAEDELRNWMDERLARFKHPKTILSVQSLPHTPTGKLQRPTLGTHFGLE